MEPENLNQDTSQVEQKSSLHQVTPLSKYLAMGLFIILPFVGGYIGYTFVPEKVVEVEKVIVKEVEAEKEVDGEMAPQPTATLSADKEIPYKQFVEVDASDYPSINKDYFIDNPSESLRLASDDTGVREALRLDDTTLLLFVTSSYNMHLAYLLYDEAEQEVIKEVTFPLLSLYTWYDNSTLVYVGGDANMIVMKDYLSDRSVVLYEEEDETVQLVEIWEMGQVGELDFVENEIEFSRYKKQPGTTLTQFIEKVKVPIPEYFLSEF